MGNRTSKPVDPLVEAATAGDLVTVRTLLEQGSNINVTTMCGTNALVKAAECCRLDVVRYLVEQGANINAKNSDKWTALMMAASNDHLDVVRYLVEHGADIEVMYNGRWTALVMAAERGYLHVVRYLVEHGADIESKVNGGWTALVKAAECCRLDVVRYLVERGADIEATINGEWTALMRATVFGHLDVVRYLVEQGADTEVKNCDGWTALLIAASYDHLDVVNYLVEHGVDINAKSNGGWTALSVAYICEQLKVMRYLVEHGADIDANSIVGSTALMKADQSVHLNRVRYLVEHDADINALNSLGWNALMKAVECSHLDVARYLVEHDADPSVLDPNTRDSVLIRIVLLGKNEEIIRPVAKLVLDHGCPPLHSNNDGKSAKSIARDKGYHSVIDLIDEYALKSRLPVRFSSDSVNDAMEWFISPKNVSYARQPFTAGGFGKVYRAMWEHKDVILKEISINSDSERRTFLREANNWHKARHPNIVSFYGANHLQTPYFMISQFATRGTLREYLSHEKEKHGRSVVWRKLLEVAHGLSFLHGLNIIHGDLKGDNIVVSEDGTAMLTDFGLSFVDTGSRPQQDNLGAMRWRAPEYATQSNRKPSFESDVYSLGMCIVEAVTEDYPWGSLPDASVTFHLRNGRDPIYQLNRPNAMSDESWKLVQGMIGFERTDRTSLAKVIDQLAVFAEIEEINERQNCPS